ncbi:hypothetical protein [Nocardioides sp. B-3]|uniref:hypothetical protein n=1 Tax=Nocardioides sp. B-3 TaxID=2895565 RepID=UPI0021528899|nr:hypothetical protein [Nocardioides sp. B-3]UUZ58460.1 hypothetical protein LP418_20095 [Nocardioides sp. B-3]
MRATRRCGVAGSTTTTTAATCSPSRSTARSSRTTRSRRPWNRIVNKDYVHRVAQFFATGWPVNYWRIDAMTDTDFEWFEHKYPRLVQQVRQVVGGLQPPGPPGQQQADRVRERGLQLPTPVLDLHGALPHP